MLQADKLVILDRDGVINEDSDAYIKSLAEWHPYPSAIEGIARLTKAGFTVAVATNQSGIARGYYDETTLAAIHEAMHEHVNQAGGKLSHVAHCPHGPDDGCTCRKPLPGLLTEIRDTLGLDSLEGSWMVGDSLRDLQAGTAVGCHPILVRTGKGSNTEQLLSQAGIDARRFDDLSGFVDWLLG
ncbi:D-glycero-beta-D-manno-heptose 1,7-bisphosphate 7-phosphatase [Litchfieldella xinjiangensis]|uniref:D-glycero-beta-D-manno-heptose 1,7-bisphosphate 7-phosphatase n=1 Tax=Litchfieldella xinjiangensis TaxID=1166948 RepID=UPI0005BDF716|nr:D-glycero-beta-D-manno-heptose 1,7-bisphosphate 7-phosphatase [Halomonas xinjiangensis]